MDKKDIIWTTNKPLQSEELIYIFGEIKTEYSIYSVQHPYANEKNLVLAYHQENDIHKKNNSTFEIPANINIDSVKKLVNDTIVHFDQKQCISFSDIPNFLQTQIENINNHKEQITIEDSQIKILDREGNYSLYQYPSGLYAIDYQDRSIGMTLYTSNNEKNIERKFNDIVNLNQHECSTALNTGYIQGVCECVAIISDDYTLGKKLLSKMNVNRELAKKYANPETYKILEKGIFSQKQDQKLEQTQGLKR